MPLNDQRRAQLDSIVSKMAANQEPDSAVQAVVNDFKGKYENEGVAQQPSQKPLNFLQKAGKFLSGRFGEGVGQALTVGTSAYKGAEEAQGKNQALDSKLLQRAGELKKKGKVKEANQLLSMIGGGNINLEDTATDSQGFVSNKDVLAGGATLATNLLSGGSLTAGGKAGSVAAPLVNSKLTSFLAGKAPNVLARVAGKATQAAGVGALGGGLNAAVEGEDILQGAQSGALTAGGMNLGGQAVGGALKFGGKVIRETLGKTTGAGSEAILEAAANPSRELISAMRGKTGTDDILESTQIALENVKDKQRAAYVGRMAEAKNSGINISPDKIKSGIKNSLEKFRISVGEDGMPVFGSLSPITDASEQGKIKKVLQAFNSLPDNSVDSLDALKQVVDNQYSVNDSARTKSVIMAVKKAITKELNTVPGYADATKGYAKTSELLNDVSKGLSINDKGNKATTFSKLSTAMRDGQGFRRDILDQLDREAGTNVKGQIAGAALSPALPTGIAGSLFGTGAGAGATASILNPQAIPALLGYLAASSPRLVGEGAVKYGQATKMFKGAKGQELLKFLQQQALLNNQKVL